MPESSNARSGLWLEDGTEGGTSSSGYCVRRCSERRREGRGVVRRSILSCKGGSGGCGRKQERIRQRETG